MEKLSYELCKELKEAGFPQEYRGGFYRTPEIKYEVEKIEPGKIIKIDNNVDVVYFPTLSELIEACGNDFGTVGKSEHAEQWAAATRSFPQFVVFGSTPEEAVATLYIKLHEKNT